jgi:hypothetical protein
MAMRQNWGEVMKYTVEEAKRVCLDFFYTSVNIINPTEVKEYIYNIGSALIKTRLELEQANLEIERLRNCLKEPD